MQFNPDSKPFAPSVPMQAPPAATTDKGSKVHRKKGSEGGNRRAKNKGSRKDDRWAKKAGKNQSKNQQSEETKNRRGKAGGRQAKSQNDRNSDRRAKKSKSKGRRNTTDFSPRYDPPDLRVVTLSGRRATSLDKYSVHDVMISPDFFCDTDDLSMYDSLVSEIKKFPPSILKKWHGDSHHIADDRALRGRWKEQCPTFLKVVERMESYFGMKVGATRFNWYQTQDSWKPQHHDRAAFTKNCPQNLTIAASFGCERECCFEQVGSGSRIHMPLANGSMYAFGRDVNIEWKHGIVGLSEEEQQQRKSEPGRISIIAWGWVDQDTAGSRCSRVGEMNSVRPSSLAKA